ncbi:MAG TPA: TonB-dependent receptor [Novosphingobium sp.]|nr:TonB-dependent receptor [Novosphingobium sp.]
MTALRGQLLSGACVALLALAASPALAQSKADEAPKPAGRDAGTPEIVVTAQFRAQKLQDTPLAITAVNSAVLAARGQTSVADVAAQAPNVSLAPQGQQNGSGMIAFIRGVGQTDFNFAVEPGVAMYVDDVYIPSLTGSLLDLMDLDRVEVLRGPQGTLSGRNAIGGAIKLFSAKPKGTNTGSIQMTYGSYNRIDLRGMIDLKLTDNLAMRVSGVSKSRDGFVQLLDYGATHPGSGVQSYVNGANAKTGTLGGQNYAAGKIALRWNPAHNIEVNVSGDYTRDRSEAGASVLLYANNKATNANGQPWMTNTVSGGAVALNCAFVPNGVNSCDTLSGYNRSYVSYANFSDNTPATTQSPYKPFTITNPHQWLDNYGVSASIDIDLSDSMKLTSITAWRHFKSDWSDDVDNTPLADQQLAQVLVNDQWSQELRLNGKAFGNKLEYTVGGFYFSRTGYLTGRIDLNYAGIDFLHGPDQTPASNKALFANGILHVTDALNITGGIRESWDSKDYYFQRHNPDGTDIQSCAYFAGAATAGPTGIGNAPNCLLYGLNGADAHFKSSRFDWRVAADYRFSKAIMAYAQVSTGYRAGGVNPRPFFGPSSPYNQIKTFNPETLTAYELGIKTDLFDRRLRFNLSAFYNDYKNIILSLSACPISPCLMPANVGAAHVKGFEIETQARPIPGLTLDGSLSYLDFKYTSFNIDTASLGGLNLNMVTPYTPKWKWSFGVQYDIHEVLGGTVMTRFDGQYQSHVYTEAINVDNVPVAAVSGPLATYYASNRIDGYFLGNARISWKQDKSAPLMVSLEVQNLFNKYYFTSLYEQYASPGTVSGAPGLPRTWSVTVKKEF